MLNFSKAGRLFAFSFFLLSFAVPSLAFNVVNGNSEGTGSLTWAIQQANQGGDSSIIITPSVKLISLNRELTIESNVTINGNGATIIGNSQSRLFRITSGRAVFNRLTFTGGNAASGSGGAVDIDGAEASAEFNNCTFTGNSARDYGGAVSVTRGNENANTILKHCTIAGNMAAYGGGVALAEGEMSLMSSVIVGNTGSNDIYAVSSRYFRSHYNVAGSSNFDLDATDLTGQTLSNVLMTENGVPKVESEDNTRVIRLSRISPARDYVPYTAGYVLSIDEAGHTRPQLSGYDAGAYEAMPVAITSAEIYGLPYLQINDTGTFRIDIKPETASLNVKDYQPYGVEWLSSSPTVLTIDNSGHATAVGMGSSYITARVHGWNADGTAQTLSARAFTVYVGGIPFSDMRAVISGIDDRTIAAGRYETLKPEVKITIGDYTISDLRGGVSYTISASSSRADIVMADIVSNDTVRLIAGNNAGSADVTVTATPYPLGQSMTERFTVTVTDNGGSNGGGNVGGSGGGCESFGALLAGIGAIAFAVIRRKD